MRMNSILLIAAALGCGLVAGVFFAFSTFVMRALDQMPPAQGVHAFQNINVTVYSPLFMAALFGTGLLCVYLIFASYGGAFDMAGNRILIGAVCYLAGVIGVTMFCNVPLNNALANVSLGDADIALRWRDFYGPWLNWNHVRTVAAFCSSLAFILALVAS
jgi:uncharacterized membrane protein